MWILVLVEFGGISAMLKSQSAIELRELLYGAFALVEVLKPLLNGVDFADFPLLVNSLSDENTRSKLYEAVEGLRLIGPDIGSITIDELLEIVSEFKLQDRTI